ncbi:MAG: hypothetical protein IAG13_11115 [Deltaproteobacteria bacterium]|nr:hypothetical protein [Nannocystaceae bacterium]
MRVQALLVILLGTGCMTGDGMQTKLRDATTEYNRALRWRDIDIAAGFLPAESKQAFMLAHEEHAEELIVVDYELMRLDLDKETGVAASRAQIWWHTDDSTVVEHTMVDQLWQFHEGAFVLVDERRTSGTRLGLFAELVEEEHPWLPGLQKYRVDHEVGEENKHKHKPKKKKKPKTPGPVAPPASWPGGGGELAQGTAHPDDAMLTANSPMPQ